MNFVDIINGPTVRKPISYGLAGIPGGPLYRARL